MISCITWSKNRCLEIERFTLQGVDAAPASILRPCLDEIQYSNKILHHVNSSQLARLAYDSLDEDDLEHDCGNPTCERFKRNKWSSWCVDQGTPVHVAMLTVHPLESAVPYRATTSQL